MAGGAGEGREGGDNPEPRHPGRQVHRADDAFLPDFRYDPTEARFIGSPVDLIIFPGLAKGDPEEIVIMEIKTGPAARLTPQERKIQQLIENGMVRWELIERRGEDE